MDQGLDSVENGVKAKPQDKQSIPQSQGTVGNQQTPMLQSYSKYDFIQGEKIIYFDDFLETAIGDFPPNWNTNASGEVVNTNQYAGHWFRMAGSGCVALEEGLKLPDNYTIEFDVILSPSDQNESGLEFGFYLYNAENPKDLSEGGAVPGNNGIKMNFADYRATYSAYQDGAYTLDGEKENAGLMKDRKYRISFWVQKTRLRVYLEQDKIFDLPKVFKAGLNCNMARFELWNSANLLVTNFRIATGLPDMRSKLLTEGKLVSYGIYFDVNKDVVKPESYTTLRGIGDILKENPGLRIKIVGYTDSDGDDVSNLDLSKRRAIAVKKELCNSFGAEASRIETDGKGETLPIAPNNSSSNKALNRRVEFIKL